MKEILFQIIFYWLMKYMDQNSSKFSISMPKYVYVSSVHTVH